MCYPTSVQAVTKFLCQKAYSFNAFHTQNPQSNCNLQHRTTNAMLHHAEIVLENVILAYYTSICKLSVLVDILQYSVSFYIYNHFCSMWKDVGDFFFLSLFQFLISTIWSCWQTCSSTSFHPSSLTIFSWGFSFSSHLTSPQLHRKALSHRNSLRIAK